MCVRGTTTLVALKTGDVVEVDACIAPLVMVLNDGGIPTVGSCCGHEEVTGHIQLADGRLLLVRKMTEETVLG